MIKIVGSVLIVGASAAFGLRRKSWYQRRCRVLSELVYAAGRMEAELSGRETETEELLLLLGKGETAAAKLFRAWAMGMEGLENRPLAALWEDCVLRADLPLKEEERETVLRLGQILGRYDGRLQTKLLSGLRQELEQYLSTAREEGEREGKSAVTVSCTIGLLAALMLM